MITLLLVLPWAAGIAWTCSRGGWSLLRPEDGPELESQAGRLRAFRGA